MKVKVGLISRWQYRRLRMRTVLLWILSSLHLVHICRKADKFCLHCNIFIFIRHIWIKPVLCSRMVSLSHHTSPWTHRCLQCSHSAHRNGRVSRRSVQTACCYWILNRGKSSFNWNSQTNASRLWLITRPEESYRMWCVVVCVSRHLVNEKVMARVGPQHQKLNM